MVIFIRFVMIAIFVIITISVIIAVFVIITVFVVIAMFAGSQTTIRTANGSLVQSLAPDELRARVTSIQRYGQQRPPAPAQQTQRCGRPEPDHSEITEADGQDVTKEIRHEIDTNAR